MELLADRIEDEAPVSRRVRVESGLVASDLFRAQSGKESAILDRMRFYNVPGVSIAVLHNREVDWTAGYGVKEIGREDAVTPDTMFQALSVTKMITAMGVLKLAIDGAFRLDDDVNTHLKGWKLQGDRGWSPTVTIRQLLSHTAGINFFNEASAPQNATAPTLDQILDGLPPALNAPVRVKSMPGVSYVYAGGGYMVLQKLVEDKTGATFEEAMKALVLEPLGMTHSTFAQPLPKRLYGNTASGHYTATPPSPQGKWVSLPEIAASGLWSSAVDIARAAAEIQNALIDKPTKVLNSQMAIEMMKRHATNAPVGLGVFTKNEGDPEAYYFNIVGATPMYRTTMLAYVLSGNGIIVMANSGFQSTYLTKEIISAVSEEYGWKGFTPEPDPDSGLPDATLSGDYDLGGSPFSVHVTRETMELFGPKQSKPLVLKRRQSGEYKADGVDVTILPSPTEWSSLIIRQNDLEWTLKRKTSR